MEVNGVEPHENLIAKKKVLKVEKVNGHLPIEGKQDLLIEDVETECISNGLSSDEGQMKVVSEETSPGPEKCLDNSEVAKMAINKDQEIVFIQDAGFTIKISVVGLELFDLQVSSMELVQEIHQVLIDREDTCHRTCFSLQLDGNTLDNFVELKDIDALKEGSVVKVVEEPYSVREARIHVRHVRDLLKSVHSADAYNGIDCMSLSYLNAVTNGDVLDKKKSRGEMIDCTPPDCIMPGRKERPLLPLHPPCKDSQAQQCLKVLTYSGWNTPPGNRKMHGDLLYLQITTLEDKKYHVTASPRGFFVSQSTDDVFNPKPAAIKHLSHSLIDLLIQISPLFKKNFQILLKKRAQKHPFERVATPYQVYSWLAPNTDHTVDSIRAEDAFSSRLGYEEHIPGQARDWNEELQTTRELPHKNLPERLVRERAIFKVHSDFVVAATRGAVSVIDGNIMAINPGEDPKMQMFLWNNIFFSLGFDVKDHYKELGGDNAAYVAPSNDLQGVKAYAGVDVEGLYTLGTVVVDYRGYRVTAQSIIPGILEREQEQSVVYGSTDFGKTFVTNEKFQELLKKSSTSLKICPHKVVTEKNDEVELLTSVECKGIIGNDSRHYVLDLLRTFPADVNFLQFENEKLSEAMQKFGFPRKHPHKLACLRQELIDFFTEHRYVMFVKQAAHEFQMLRQKNTLQKEESEASEKNIRLEKLDNGLAGDTNSVSRMKEDEVEKSSPKVATESEEKIDAKKEIIETMETEEAKKIVESMTKENVKNFEAQSKEIVQRSGELVGSLSDTEFNISFNNDLFQNHVNHADKDSVAFKRQVQLVKDAAEFLVSHQIPNFINDCLDHSATPIDGLTLSDALHHQGINIRYLGFLVDALSQHPEVSYLHGICVAELICRSAKHIYKTTLQNTDVLVLSVSISHFLNCLLSAYPVPHAQVAEHEDFTRNKRRNRRKNKHFSVLNNDTMEWMSESPKSLWRKIVHEMQSYYYFTMSCESIESACEKYQIQKVSLLRNFCQKVGIQVLLQDYNLDNKNSQCFYEHHIVNVFPVVRHIHPKASDAYHVFTTGQQKIQQGMLRDGYELISEAMNLLNNVYGALHPEIAACSRLLARLNYIMCDYGEALLFQQRAVLMSERVLGIDHPNTITEYAHLSLYSFANNQIPTALKLMYRARYLALTCYGERHPEVALFDSNIGLILHAVNEFDLSLKFLLCALGLNMDFFGPKSLKVAMSHHLVARAHSCKGDFRTALHSEKDAYAIYKTIFGEQHERTKESNDCLRHLTEQAVKFQKTMNNIVKGDHSLSSLAPPLMIQTPSLSSVLDTLNLINGIGFVHLSQTDIDKFKEEMIQSQVNGSDMISGSGAVKSKNNNEALARTKSPLSSVDEAQR